MDGQGWWGCAIKPEDPRTLSEHPSPQNGQVCLGVRAPPAWRGLPRTLSLLPTSLSTHPDLRHLLLEHISRPSRQL